jgi:hypothetical protein
LNVGYRTIRAACWTYLGAGRSGLDLQAELGDKQEMIPIIFITGTGDVEPACAP